MWHPEGAGGPGLTVEAFGEAGSSLTVPAPMVRVKEGTKIVASIANQMDVPLVVHGLCARDAGRCSPLSVPAGDTRSTEFSAGRPGTYHYWATAMGAPGAVSRTGRGLHCRSGGRQRQRPRARYHRVDQPLAARSSATSCVPTIPAKCSSS